MVSTRGSRGKTVAVNPVINPVIKPITIHAIAVGPTGQPMIVKSARLTIRSDEAARRTISDTDGTVRRARQVAETNRLI
ncbi:hypothetical protein [Mesorhizobium carmichaelinearum]|uniref:hypothetical protein n=1 Tax=Mesorhizobium carmichaelinearum TaxID=1208188 RepID=UPI000BA4CCD4|nr:hypothetical protein [Mesorhizobium carmichaelinearum]